MSAVFTQLSTSYLQSNQLFVVFHGALLLWAIAVFVRGSWMAARDRAWLRRGGDATRGRLASLWERLYATRNARRLELRDLYEAQAGVDSDDLARIANLFLLIGVAGTLWSLAVGAGAVQARPPGGEDVAAADALIPVLRSFNAFSVTIVSVGLAFFVLVFQRVLGRKIAGVAFEAAQGWKEAATGNNAVDELRGAVAELTTCVRSLGPQGGSEWARAEVQKIAAALAASARDASQQMTSAAGALATRFTEALAPLASQIAGAVGPVVDRLDGVTAAFQTSVRGLETQRQLLEKHAAVLEAIHDRLGAAETAVEHLREVPAVVGSSLHDIGKHVGATLETLHGNFEAKLEHIFKMHEGAVVTVARRMEETESHLAAAVENGTAEVKQYLLNHGTSLSETVDGMLANAARASEASVWAPARRAVEDLVSQAQRAAAGVRTVEGAAMQSVQQSITALDQRVRAVQDEIVSLTQRATLGVSAVESHATTAVAAVQDSVAELGNQARTTARQLGELRGAMAGMDEPRSSGRRSIAVAQWVSTGVLTVAMLLICTLFYTRLGH
jgi:hypothetical protein